MLILTRKPGESIYIGEQIKVTVVELKGNQIRVGVEAPKELRIYREEIYLQILEENKEAAGSAENTTDFDKLSESWRKQKGVGKMNKLNANVKEISSTKIKGDKDSNE